MRFLRMLTNAVLAGALGAAYLTILVLQLNPQIPLASSTTWRWFATFGLFYGVHLAVVFYVLMVAREFFSMDVMSPGWVSVRVLAWLAAALAAGAALLMWLNVRELAPALTDTAGRRMTAGAVATTAAALILLGIAIAHYSFGRRGSAVGAALLVMASFGSLALPLAARGPAVPRPTSTSPAWVPDSREGPEPGPHVVALLLDGASLDYIWPGAAEGRLPNFARLLEMGATIDLASVRPTTPESVWTTAATGLYPSRSGVRGDASYFAGGDTRAIDLLPEYCLSHALVRLGIVRSELNTSEAVRARPIWDVLSAADISVGIVRWPLTYPASPVDGFIVSERFHELLGSMLELDARAAFPLEALPLARAAFAEMSRAAESAPEIMTTDGPLVPSPDTWSTTPDRSYSRTMDRLRKTLPIRFLALRFHGLDAVAHTKPRDGASDRVDERRHLQALDRYYAYLDTEIGVALETLTPGDLLLVVSGFGLRRLNPVEERVGRFLRDPALSGTHGRTADGFLVAYGTSVEPGRQPRGSIADLAPTVLYFLGLPVGRDMDGFARADLFTREFTAERPIAFIPSYNQ